MKAKILIGIYSLLLMLFCAFRIYNNNGFVPSWDGAEHLRVSFLYYKALSSENWTELYNLYFKSSDFYPPLYRVLVAISFMMFGVLSRSSLYVNVIFIPVLVFSTYLLGSIVFNKKVGLISSILVPLLPLFLSLQENTFIDYASISLFILLFYTMFKTDYFRNTKFTVIFGVVTFINLMTKWPVVVPAISFGVYFLRGLYINKIDRRKILLNLLVLLPFILFSVTWYYFNIDGIVEPLSFFWDQNAFAQKIWNFPPLLSINNLILYIYPVATGERGFGVIPLSVFFISLFLKIEDKKQGKISYLLISTIVTYVVLTILNDKADKYIGYVYPLIIIYTVGKILFFKKNIIKIFLISIFSISIVANVVYIFATYSDRFQPRSYEFRILPGYDGSLDSKYWPTKYIVNEVIAKKCSGTALVLTDHKYINQSNLNYYAMVRDVDITFTPGYSIYDPSQDVFDDLDIIKKYSCLVTKSGYIGGFANRDIANRIENHAVSLDMHSVGFSAPDKSVIKVYYW